MILFACIVVVLVLALVATQLKVRVLAESLAGEKVRNDAQRAQFDRDTRSLQMECEELAGAAESRAARWKAVSAAGLGLSRAGSSGESWHKVAELLRAAGHFRVVAVRLRDPASQSFVLECAAGIMEEKVAL